MDGYLYSEGGISDAECIEGTRCPYCSAEKGEPCVYATPDSRWYTEAQLRKWGSLRAQFKRAGKPTKRVHPHRRDIMRRRRWTHAIAKQRRRTVVPTPEHIRANWRAQLAFDQRENEQLRRWFLLWGDMFESNTLDKPDEMV